MKIFLTGLPGSGKSTVLMKVIKLLSERKLKVGGVITPEIRSKGERIGFAVKDVYSGKEGMLASIKQKVGPRLGKYRVNLENFEEVALPALDFAIKNCDLIAIDEIGKLEFFSKNFHQKVYEIVNSNKPLIAVIHRNYIKEFEIFGELIVATKENRDKLPNIIFDRIIQSLKLN
jgi:nucleoside-triphosphatase